MSSQNSTPFPGPPVAGWSGLYNNVYGEQYRSIDASAFRRRLRRAMKNYHNPYNRIISAVVQGVGNAYGDYYRVASQNPDNIMTLGGVRGTEKVVVVDRPPTNADKAMIRDDLYNARLTSLPYVEDKSGNGGGGKGRY